VNRVHSPPANFIFIDPTIGASCSYSSAHEVSFLDNMIETFSSLTGDT